MRSYAIITWLCAALPAVFSLRQSFHSKSVKWDCVTGMVTVTVTASQLPLRTLHRVKAHVVQLTVLVNPIEEKRKHAPTLPFSSSSLTSPSPLPATTTTTGPPPPPGNTSKISAPRTTQATSFAIKTAGIAQVDSLRALVASSAPASISSGAQVAVDYHNSCRGNHSAGRMNWNETLAAYAAITAGNCDMNHDMDRGGGGYGQNLASQGSTKWNAWNEQSSIKDSIMNQWYSELTAFTKGGYFGRPSPPSSYEGIGILHFTQVVWRESTSVGCAVQACPLNSLFPPDKDGNQYYAWYTVCNYYPAGNVLGSFIENVSAN